MERKSTLRCAQGRGNSGFAKMLTMLAMMLFVVTGAWAQQVSTTKLIDYPTNKSGITARNATESQVNINLNTTPIYGYSLTSNYSATNNHLVLEVEGGFKAGDVVTIAGAYNSAQNRTINLVIFTVGQNNSTTRLHTTANLVNGRSSASDPSDESYTLTADADKLYIGRPGNTNNTGAYVTKVTVTRSVTTYSVSLAEGTEDADKWAINPTEAAEGQNVTLTYSGDKEVKSITAKVFYPATATAPTANTVDIVANSTTQLVIGGTAQGGTMMYAVTETNTKPTSTNDFSADVPTAVGRTAGTYYIWYYVKADDTHFDSEISSEAIEVKVYAPVPEGAINGKFTIASGKQVYFSKGNLRATTTNGSSWTWAFATNQWDYIGNAAANTTISGNGTVSGNGTRTVDLFGWVASNSSWSGAAQYGISNSTSSNSYGNGNTLKSDWGSTIEGDWRTLTQAEWNYLLNTRTTTSGVRYVKARVNNVNGVILLPDDWNTNYYTLNSTNTANANYTSNTITSTNWTNNLEAHGAVFLPAAGMRGSTTSATTVNSAGSNGNYWSTTSSNGNSNYVTFSSNSLNSNTNNRTQHRYGCSVRLVIPVE